MSDKLPIHIDPIALAERRSVLTGVIEMARLERLSAVVIDSDVDVCIEVSFGKQGKHAVLNGNIQAKPVLACQSCLQAMVFPLDIAFRLAVVSSMDEADQLDIDYEPLLLDGDKVSLNTLIEDEILLALPDYPRHDDDCISQRVSKDANYVESSPDEGSNPFSVLAQLKPNLKKTGE
ncbi:MAG: DUF177 domain-containing protein [Methylomonas sp.]|nr:DUF177 domain-containing protein [Methylomonas sp.]PPD19680.1 MAG: hypothetical protein CTY23_11140 [Methylomonas sp.]PPD25823.1 MAG: hypothetical protein CTY22_07245 [Methylomonas sp.]PPD37282.1 MAG: hypothetical protein CTY21_07245 [Methylomonas sp.]PPD39048.1 MAG: hypothetical protein CTY17_08585 [Methylomonas sp.]